MMPFLAWWGLGMRTAQMLAEANTVIAMRSLGAFGLWPVAAGEARRMWMEKPGAFVESAGRATTAMVQLKRPDQIVDAALKPIGRKTRSNSRRLSKRRRR
ncbi:antifreeze protein [Alphaproteobacteria bacterium GH1-50]|uniref:Antifreeze protein n=1 Tax=Kangsaoukella pontilimi TaxID=2691042 RepID=A0A7C9IG02_9RHOB|nr:antifreeze protein [Kangsaoukella pontilimi]MXQ07709.1 antifreeze protein [Kangsaoukella pontilimi]